MFMQNATLAFATILLGSVLSASAGAEVKQDVKDVAKDVKAGAKKVMNKASEAACPLVDGKVQCAAKKAKHKVEETVDKK